MLRSQVRLLAGDRYIRYIDDVLRQRAQQPHAFPGYEFRLYAHLDTMVSDIQRLDAMHGLCRLVAGYAWCSAVTAEPRSLDFRELAPGSVGTVALSVACSAEAEGAGSITSDAGWLQAVPDSFEPGTTTRVKVNARTDFLERGREYTTSILLRVAPDHTTSVPVRVLVPRLSAEEAADLSHTIQKQDAELSDFRERMRELELENERLRGRITELNETIATMSRDQKQVQSLRDRIAALEKDRAAHAATISSLESELSTYRLARDLGTSAFNSIVDGIRGMSGEKE